MMHLLPVVNKYFKGNLHTHSRISDGTLTPEEMISQYRDRGYDFLCMTDHNVIANHQKENSENFLLLTGTEINLNNLDGSRYYRKTYHILFISKDPNSLWQAVEPPRMRPFAAPYEELVQAEPMACSYDVRNVNAMIARAKEQGFLAAYCHPEWSGQTYPDYADLEGVWAMEIRNNDCSLMGQDINNHWVYQDMLEQGKKVFPLATDDAHKPEHVGGGWIRVGAEKLEYSCVMDALERGDFYASCGPEIHSLTLEGDTLKITCSEANRIVLHTQCRVNLNQTPEAGKMLNEAAFDLSTWREASQDDPNAFIRLMVYAPDGTFAATRAYWLREL